MQNTGFRHSTSEYEDVNQSTVRAAEIGAYPRSNKRSSMIQQPVVSNPLPPLPNKFSSTRSINTVASIRNSAVVNNDTLFLEMLLPMLDKVSHM
jgi:serine/threonine-protein kinase 24/25/MST4